MFPHFIDFKLILFVCCLLSVVCCLLSFELGNLIPLFLHKYCVAYSKFEYKKCKLKHHQLTGFSLALENQ